MPSAGSHKSRVIEFSTSITGRRSARPQEIGRNGTYLERELDDSIPLPKGARPFSTRPPFSPPPSPPALFFPLSLVPTDATDRIAIDPRGVHSQ